MGRNQDRSLSFDFEPELIDNLCFILVINGTKIVKLRNPWGAGEWKGEWGDDWIVEHANSKLRNINSEQRAKLGIGSTDWDRP